MPTTPINASRYPALTAAPNGPQQIQDLATDLDDNLVPRYTTTGTRDTAIPTPVDGMLCAVAGRNQRRAASTWIDLAADAWVNLSLNASNFRVYTEGGTYRAAPQYRREGDRLWLNGYVECFVNSSALGSITSAGAIPSALRPTILQSLWAPVELAVPIRLEITTAGTIRTYRAITAPVFFDLTGLSWAIG